MMSIIHGLPGQNPKQFKKDDEKQNVRKHPAHSSSEHETSQDKGHPIKPDPLNDANKLAAELTKMNDIDHTKVATLKAMIKRGEFSVDPEKIAEMILDFEGQLSGHLQEEE